MQCVILAAGEGTRMRPLTLEYPKPLIEVCGKPLLAHIIDALPHVVDEVIVVVGYKGEMIRSHFGESYGKRRMRYVVQENPKGGTADALFAARALIAGKFLVMYGDDIHGAGALAEVVGKPHGMLAAHSDHPEKFGVIAMRDNGTLAEIIEKPEIPPSHMVNIGGFVLMPEVFAYKAPLSAHNEYFLTDVVSAYAKQHPVSVVEQDVWIPLGYPEDVLKAEKILCP